MSQIEFEGNSKDILLQMRKMKKNGGEVNIIVKEPSPIQKVLNLFRGESSKIRRVEMYYYKD